MLVGLLLTCTTLSEGQFALNGPVRAHVPTKMSRPALKARALMAMASGRNSRKADVYINADRSLQMPISSRIDEGTSLTSYMRMPAILWITKFFPSKLKRVEGDKYQAVIPPLKFFDWEVNPITYSYIRQTDSSVVIESNESTLKGTPLIESLNGLFFFQIRTELSWKDEASAKTISARSQVEMWVNPPAPFNFIPSPIAETGGNAVFQLVLDALHREFLNPLEKDIKKFLTSGTYRQEWASIAEAATAADVKSSASPTSLFQTSSEAITVSTDTVIAFLVAAIVACGVTFAMLGRRQRIPTAAEEPFLAA